MGGVEGEGGKKIEESGHCNKSVVTSPEGHKGLELELRFEAERARWWVPQMKLASGDAGLWKPWLTPPSWAENAKWEGAWESGIRGEMV